MPIAQAASARPCRHPRRLVEYLPGREPPLRLRVEQALDELARVGRHALVDRGVLGAADQVFELKPFLSGERWPTMEHLEDDTSERPHVDRLAQVAVGLRLRRRCNLGRRIHRRPKPFCEPFLRAVMGAHHCVNLMLYSQY